MTQPFEAPAFRNSAEFTVAVTFVVAGGQRSVTADRRARRIFEQIANHTARLKDVLDVAALGGPSHQGQLLWSHPVAFTAANTGSDPLQTGKLLRYHDPDYERAKRLLAAANDAARRRREADRRRRSALGCANAHPSVLEPQRRSCDCAYCQPEDHLLARRSPDVPPGPRARCLCGQPVASHGQRCTAHRRIHLELLDGDPATLRLLADYVAVD